MEEDLNIYSQLSKRQYGFTKGASTEKSHPELGYMALGKFLDIGGAFENVAFCVPREMFLVHCQQMDNVNYFKIYSATSIFFASDSEAKHGKA